MEGDPESQSSTKKSERWACLSPPALSWDFCRSLQQGPSVAPAFLRGLGCLLLVDTYSSSSSLSAGGLPALTLESLPRRLGPDTCHLPHSFSTHFLSLPLVCPCEAFRFLGSFKCYKLMSVPSWKSREHTSSRGKNNDVREERSPEQDQALRWDAWAGLGAQGLTHVIWCSEMLLPGTELTTMERGSKVHIFGRI